MVTDSRIHVASIVVRRQDLLATPIGDDLAMLSVERGCYYYMNSTGRRVWSMLTTAIPVSELCEALEREYSVDPITCECEVLSLLRDLERERLIVVAGECGA